jgi:hypothetical protein
VLRVKKYCGWPDFHARKKSGKKFSARKKGVSSSAATRIIIRAADVQLTPDFFCRRYLLIAITIFPKMPDRPETHKFLGREKDPDFIFRAEKSTRVPARPRSGNASSKREDLPGSGRLRGATERRTGQGHPLLRKNPPQIFQLPALYIAFRSSRVYHRDSSVPARQP